MNKIYSGKLKTFLFHSSKIEQKKKFFIFSFKIGIYTAIYATCFTTDGIYLNTMCAVPLVNHFRTVANAFRTLTTHCPFRPLCRGGEFLKAVYWLISVSTVWCIFNVFDIYCQYGWLWGTIRLLVVSRSKALVDSIDKAVKTFQNWKVLRPWCG